MNVRAVAAQVLFQVIDQGQSLSSALPEAQSLIRPRDHALLQEIVYGVLRFLPRLEALSRHLMEAPLKGKQRLFHHLILVGLYQLSFMRIPPHAGVSETVAACNALKAPRLRGLINAVLRHFQRRQDELTTVVLQQDAARYAHPSWLLKALQQAYPEQWQTIVEHNNQKAPMWLRVNARFHSREQYQALLTQAGIASVAHPEALDALKLEHACDVFTLPGFEQGWVSVQDAAAQLAYHYLAPQDHELILDCCAAPGGKTAHILEHTPLSQVVAMDSDATRLTRVHDNLKRLGLSAEVLHGDARYPQQWWQGGLFDRILLDAPCSATGVIRRHPDIKWLRRAEDITALVEVQSTILDAMWTQLRIGGTLLYATCSILPQENQEQITRFLARTPDARLLDSPTGKIGRQILPNEQEMDGFYYAKLMKLSG